MKRTSRLLKMALSLGLPALLAACAGGRIGPIAPSAAPDFAAYVLLGEDGAASARVVLDVLDGAACPAITVDGARQAMTVRAAPATLPLRPNATKGDARPSAFAVLVCEAALPAGAASASVLGRALPLPRPEPRRIVVIGDTGCRLKKSSDEYQDCNDANAYPFATVAAAAAAWRPDLVIHVGDYHYRESPCPAGKAGCAGSPYGYGWDAWREDFFRPGAVLLQAAPWVMARGNHESCDRAGQGWWRLLDPRPLQAGRDCVLPADDAIGNYSEPYAVPLGGGAQLLVADTAATSWRGLQPGDTGYEQYRASYRRLDALSQRAAWNIGVTHHPLLGVGADIRNGQLAWHLGDLGLQQSFGSLNPQLLPARVQALLSGHIHLWQQLSFSSDHPTQFVAGFAGTAEDTVPLPATLPAGVTPAPGAVIEQFSSWIDGFGFMAMERGAPGEWTVTVHDRHGALKNRCQISGRRSVCRVTQVQ